MLSIKCLFMTNTPLPHKIDPITLAHKGASLSGTLSLHELLRVFNLLCLGDGEVHVKFEFGKDLENFYFIKGHLLTELSLQCQRCLQPVNYKIDSDFCLSPVKSDKEAANLPGDYEPLIMTEKTINILDIVEDELILNLPIAAKHDTVCSIK